MPQADVSDIQRYTESVLSLGRDAGLTHIAVAPPDPMIRARQAIESRKRDGLHDSMQFTFRNPERSTDPRRIVDGARAVIVAVLSYSSDTPSSPTGPHGLVAQYARDDHYGRLRSKLRIMRDRLRRDGFRALDLVDDNSMVDREIAWLGGLGWFGKSANLLIRGEGSLFVLGSVVTTAPLKVSRAPEPDGCGSCRVCIDSCPTRAIVADGVIDARRCLSWLLQRPGVFPREFRESLGDRIYGCDDCQESCPENVRLNAPRRLAGRTTTWMPILEMLELDDHSLGERVAKWYVPERDMSVVRRNALIVLGNTGDRGDLRVVDVVRSYLHHPDEMLRAQAVWTANRLKMREYLPSTDESEIVQHELRLCTEPPHL